MFNPRLFKIPEPSFAEPMHNDFMQAYTRIGTALMRKTPKNKIGDDVKAFIKIHMNCVKQTGTLVHEQAKYHISENLGYDITSFLLRDFSMILRCMGTKEWNVYEYTNNLMRKLA